jgi:VIT1/CCC1 family predicted Fe2+/Mn2+ transporter
MIKFKDSFKTGLSFGLTSGIITTLGLITGLYSGTHSKMVIVGGILVIAISDALSDALGIHISEEASQEHTEREIWESTISTFFSKFFMALSFVVPVFFLELSAAIIISISWGFFLIAVFSFYIAKQQQKKNPFPVIFEHLFITILVIIITHYVGNWVGKIN